MDFAGYLTAKGAFRALAMGCALAATAAAGSAWADVDYVVQRGHTLESIAHRYHVSVQAIVDANHLRDTQHLKPGQTLVIPGIEPTERTGGRTDGDTDRMSAAGEYPMPRGPFDRDVIHAARPEEAFRIRVKDSRGKISSSSLREFEQMMRQGEGPNAATHPPDPRLVALIGLVSNHFGGRTLEIVSGYRAYKPTQYTAQSRHNYGRALDFRIRGVPNETLRDFCRTLRDTGCGYYPNSTFVHMDVRDAKAYWVDLSHPGEAPNYEHAGASPDEGTSDVTSDSH
jgi:uncharacterized protein YcbK (DUF882 family)